MRQKLLFDIWAGTNMSLAKRTDLDLWPEIRALEQTPQDPEWHAEGNVLIHTDMVLAESVGLASSLPPHKRGVLRLAALLHDIAKPDVTRFDEDVQHTIAPSHERIGGIRSRYLLRELPNLSNEDRRLVSQLVSTHHLVKRTVKKFTAEDSDAGAYLDRLASRVDTELLWALEMADMRGRTSIDRENQIEIVQLFKMLCEERDVFGKTPKPWVGPDDAAKIKFHNPTAETYSYHEAHRRRLTGEIKDCYQAQAFLHGVAKEAKNIATVIITIGASGSGKSTVYKRLAGFERISPDAERLVRFGDENCQDDNGVVHQACMEQLRVVLRAGGFAFYDATNLVPDLRSKLVTLCHDYNALVSFWVFDVSLETIIKRNGERERKVPIEVIRRQIDKFEWPFPEESHLMEIFE